MQKDAAANAVLQLFEEGRQSHCVAAWLLLEGWLK